MSISKAMQSGVSGLLANSTAVDQISFNIANANTDGYRRSFAQMVSNALTTPGGGSQGSGVKTTIAHTNDTGGAFRSTGRETHMAVNGNGFFVVSRSPLGEAVGGDTPMFTRAGSFEPDKNGNLRNAAGLYLAGFPYNAQGELGLLDRDSFGGLTTINVSNTAIVGRPSANIEVKGNLPAQQAGGTPGDAFLTSVEFYSPLGAPDRLEFAWQPTSTANTWNLTISDMEGGEFGNVDVAFHDSGPFAGAPLSYGGGTNTATAPAGFSFDPITGTASVTINNGATPQVLEMQLGAPDTFDGLTQFAGDYTPLDSMADGAESGTMVRVEIDERGDIYGFFDNGTRKALYSVPLAEVENSNGLITQDNNTFQVSSDSGPFHLSTPTQGSTGSLSSGGVESSNVDIAGELTELIQKQRAYSSNAKIITTADEMLDETMRLKR